MKNLILAILTSAALLVPGVAFAAPTSETFTDDTAIAVCAMPDTVGAFDGELLGGSTFNLSLVDALGDYQINTGDTITLSADTFTISHVLGDLPAVCQSALADEVATVDVNASLSGVGAALWSVSNPDPIFETNTFGEMITEGTSISVDIAEVVLTYNGPTASFSDVSIVYTLTGAISADVTTDAPIVEDIYLP